MARDYNQTADPIVCAIAAFCSGLAANGASFSRLATFGGAGGAEGTVVIDASATNLRIVYFEIAPTGVNWDAGNWTININVTTAAANTTWESCYICRVNSSCVSQATIGSATALAISVSTTGVKSTTISGAAQTPSAGDKILIVCGFTNTNACTRTLGVTPNQVISTPFTASVQQINATPSDNVGAVFAESLVGRKPYRAGLSDAVPVSESLTGRKPYRAGLSDAVSITDSTVARKSYRAAISDDISPGFADIIARNLRSSLKGWGDGVTALERHLAKPVETVSLIDSVIARLGYKASIGDDVSAELAILVVHSLTGGSLQFSFSENVTLSESASALLRIMPVVAESIGVAESLTALQRALASLAELIPLGDAMTALLPMRALATDAVNVTESAKVLARFFGTVTDTVNVADNMAALSRLLGKTEDSFSITDSLSGRSVMRAAIGDNVAAALADFVIYTLGGGTLAFSFSENIPIAESVSAFQPFFAFASDALTFTDIVAAVGRYKFAMADAISVTDNVTNLSRLMASVADSVATTVIDNVTGRLRYKANISDAVVLSDVAVAILAYHAVLSDSISLTESANAFERLLAVVAEQLSVADVVAGLERYYASMSETVSLADVLIGVKAFIIAAEDSVPFTDSAARLVRLLGKISEVVPVTDSLSGFFRYKAAVTDTVALADVITHSLILLGLIETFSNIAYLKGGDDRRADLAGGDDIRTSLKGGDDRRGTLISGN